MSIHPGERTDLRCPEPNCGALMRLRPSKYGLFYGCTTFPDCRSTHGAHPDGSPLGIPATGDTKKARIAAHAVFDRLWDRPHFRKKERKRARNDAYRWLAAQIGVREIHIGELNVEECAKVIEVCEAAENERKQRMSTT